MKCNRTACNSEAQGWWNRIMKAFYCQPCAFRINETCERSGMPPLCSRQDMGFAGMTDNKDLPVFETQDGGKMYPPYILNNCQEYEQKVSMGNPEALDEMTRFTLMQAYFAGFAKGAGFTDMLFSSPEAEPVRAQCLAAVKHELMEFSRLNRGFAKKAGLPITTIKGGS